MKQYLTGWTHNVAARESLKYSYLALTPLQYNEAHYSQYGIHSQHHLLII